MDAQPLPASTELLRDRIAGPIPTSELPEALLEVDAWTGFSQKLVPATGTARSADLALSPRCSCRSDTIKLPLAEALPDEERGVLIEVLGDESGRTP